MEDNLHNDRLEEFLKRSLEGHSEDPPGDLWSKIEGGLDSSVAVPTGSGAVVRSLRPTRRWWMAAAAAMVVGLVIGQHLYFNGKIARLSNELERNATQLKQLEQKKISQQETFQPEEKAENPAETTTNKSNSGIAAEDEEIHDANGKSPSSLNAQRPADNAVAHSPKGQKQQINTGKGVPPAATLEQKTTSGSDVAASTTQDQTPIEKNELVQTPQVPTSDVEARVAQSDLQKLWLKRLTSIEMGEAQTPLVKADLSIVPLANRTNRITVGVNAMPMVSKGSIHEVKHDDGPGPGPGGPKKSFDVDVETSGKAWMAGVLVEANISPRLRVGTGVNYRTVDYDTKHIVCFKFGDRDHDGPGPGHEHEHDFNYDLNTAVGTVEMALRAESDEAAEDIPEDEEVKAEIKTSQRLSYVTVPIYANYSLGKGRLRALVKGGVMLNFLKENDFAIGPITPLNDKFEFRQKEKQRGSQNDLQTVTVDYVAGVGLEYQLSKAMSLRMEPTLVGSLTSLHNNPFIESSEISAGLNMGVMYSF